MATAAKATAAAIVGKRMVFSWMPVQIGENCRLRASNATIPNCRALFRLAARRLLRRRNREGIAHAETREAMAAYSGMAVKLLRTYTTQIEALAKVRRGGEQKVIVEHVHVYPGGQAIVGQVNGTGAGGVLGNARQPHATPDALAFAASPALWGQDEGRDALPVADSSRQAALPNARRGQG
jgi:hypothetical protein